MCKKDNRQKAIELINAYFDGKDIIMKDPEHGVKNWVSIHDPNYWSYLGEFIREIDKYKIVEDENNIPRYRRLFKFR